MTDLSKTKAQLIHELQTLRQRISYLEGLEAGRLRVEEALRESEARWRSLTHNSPDQIIILDKDLNIQFANYALPGFTLDELIGTPLYAYVVEKEQAEIKAILENVVLTGQPGICETEYHTPDGNTVYYESRIVPRMLEEEIVGLTVSARDITERKETEEESRFLSTLAEQSTNGIICTDTEFRITYINRTTTELFGWTLNEIKGKTPDIFNAEPLAQDIQQLIYRTVSSGQTYASDEILNKRKDGSTFYCEFKVSPLFDDQGQIYSYICSLRDVTDRKHIEEALYFIAQRGWTLDGQTFFQSLVQYLAKTLQVDYAFIGELTTNNQNVKTVALYALDQIIDNIEYDLKDTPCENVIGQKLRSYPQGIQQLFPKDDLLVEMNIEGYAGMPLWDSKGNPIGIIDVMSLTPLTNISQVESLLQIVAVRAAHELERRRSERALRESETALAKAQEIAGLGSYSWNIKTGELFWSDQMKVILGYPPTQEPAFDLLTSLIHPDDYEHALEAGRRAREEHLPFNLEYRIVRPDGTVRYIHDQAEVMRDETGKPVRMFGTSRDITKRKQAEEEIRRRNRELTLLNQIIAISTTHPEPEAILDIVCRELAIAFDAPRATATLINQEKTQARIVAKYRNPENQPDLDNIIFLKDDPLARYLFNHKAPLVINDVEQDPNLTSKHKLIRQLNAVSLIVMPLILENEVIGTLSVSDTRPRSFSAEDINLAWRVAEQVAGSLARIRLNQTQQLLTTAIEQSAESVVITDTQGNILYVNPTFERVTGYTLAEALGQNPRILNSGRQNKAYYRELWRTISNGRIWQGQFVNKKKDGTLYTEQASIAPVRDKTGAIVNYVAVKRDVTRELQMEEQYRQAQKMEAVGRLAGGVAHDFNNLLTAIMGYVGLIQAELSPDHPIYTDTQGIQNTAQRAANLTRQLLTFARRQIIEPHTVNLNDIILNLDKMLRRLIGENIELVTLPAPHLGQIKADPGQIEQVVVNLVINARDAMPEGGKLIIETANVMLDENYAQQHAGVTPGQYIMLAISDTGQGMADQVREHIFEPFFTTKEQGKGTGLGLAICFGIVKQSDGHIWVYSEEDQGTTFKVYLPRIDTTTIESAFRQRQSAELPRGTETILLVEDEATVRGLARRMLREQGYVIIEAANGQEALNLIQEQPELEIDLLLTDVIMPQMGGKVLADKLTEIRPDIKVMFISGYTDNAIIHHGMLDAGIIFLQKPFSPLVLARKVRQVLDS